MGLGIKKGDNVVIIAGKEKGKTGKINLINPDKNRVSVEGLNMIQKHKKPRNAQDKGGIIKKEGTIDISDVQVICPSCGKATRIAHSFVNGKKVRICKKCGAVLDVAKQIPVKSEKTESTKKEPAKKETTKATPKKEAVKKEVAKSTTKKSTTKSAAKKTAENN